MTTALQEQRLHRLRRWASVLPGIAWPARWYDILDGIRAALAQWLHMVLRELLIGLTAVGAFVAERREDGAPFRGGEGSRELTLLGLAPMLIAVHLLPIGGHPRSHIGATLVGIGRGPCTVQRTRPFRVGSAPTVSVCPACFRMGFPPTFSSCLMGFSVAGIMLAAVLCVLAGVLGAPAAVIARAAKAVAFTFACSPAFLTEDNGWSSWHGKPTLPARAATRVPVAVGNLSIAQAVRNGYC